MKDKQDKLQNIKQKHFGDRAWQRSSKIHNTQNCNCISITFRLLRNFPAAKNFVIKFFAAGPKSRNFLEKDAKYRNRTHASDK
jgi:hypothetical protein